MQSRVINLLRFPMAILVVFCHCKLLWGVQYNGVIENSSGHIAQALQIFFSEVIPHVAIPLFLFFSGYLFFNKGFSREIYFSKLKSRTHTLLLPYIIWCSIGYLIALYNKECSLSLLSYIQGFWDTSLWGGAGESMIAFNNMPADMPLWFLRDLIVIIILSPLIYFLIKHLRSAIIILLGIWWFSHIEPKPFGFGADTVFFFSLGAWFAINKIDFIESTKKFMPKVYIITVILMISDFIIVNDLFSETGRMGYNWYIFNAFIFTGALSLIHIASLIIQKTDITISQFWAPASFFLYAAHALYMIPLRIFLFDIFHPQSELGWIVFYFADIFAVITAAIIIFALLRKFTPRVCCLLTGGRI